MNPARSFLFFLVGLLLGGFVTFASAQTTYEALRVGAATYSATTLPAPVVAGAAVASRALPWGMALAVGTEVMGVAVKNGWIRSPFAPVAPPDGWTENPESLYSPNPPATSDGRVKVFWWNSQQYATALSACTAWRNYWGYSSCGTDVGNVDTGLLCKWNSAGSCIQTSPTGSAVTLGCTAGYTISGDQCVLTTPGAVPYPADGIATAQPEYDGSGFEIEQRDPDPMLDYYEWLQWQASSSQVTGTNNEGRKAQLTMTATGSGGVRFELKQEGSAADGTTTVQIDTMELDSHGIVTDLLQKTILGSINTPGGDVAPATEVNVDMSGVESRLDQIRDKIEQGNSADQTDRDGANSIAQGMTAALTGTEADGMNTVDGLGLPSENPFDEFSVSGAAALLPSGEGCVTMPVNLPYMSTIIIDPCPIVTVAKPILDFMIRALAAIASILAVLNFRNTRA